MTDEVKLVEVGDRRDIARIPGYLEPANSDYVVHYEFYRGDNCFNFSNKCYNTEPRNSAITVHDTAIASSTFKTKPRTLDEVFTWDEVFMSEAASSGLRSKDEHTQVGVVIEKDNNLVNSGYNGPAHGINNNLVSWDRHNDKGYRYTKYASVIHAEQNAIYNAMSNGLSINGATLYTTLFPCNECAKAIAQCGIREVVFMQIPHFRKMIGDKIVDEGHFYLSDDTMTAIDRLLESHVYFRQFTFKPERVELLIKALLGKDTTI